MMAWQAIARLLSGSSVLTGSATMIDSGLVELTVAQLDQVAGSGGAGGGVVGYAAGLTSNGGKGGMQGDLG